MRLMIVGDNPDPGLWDFFSRDKVQGIDAIISCGDLPANYLSFLVTMANVPVFYVHGNHDGSYDKKPPEGCTCIDGSVVNFKGYRILGLGGSMRYNGGAHQYTERQMQRRIQRLWWPLRQGVDILVTHAPAQGLGDMQDPCHLGFSCFVKLLDRYEPRLFIHGHVHPQYTPTVGRVRSRGGTMIVNGYEKLYWNLPDAPQ